LSLEDFRRALSLDIAHDERRKKLRQEAKEQQRLAEEAKERDGRKQTERFIAEIEAEEKKAEEIKRLEAKLVQEQRNKDFLAFLKIMKAEGEFQSEASWQKGAADFCYAIRNILAKMAVARNLGTYIPLTDLENILFIRYSSWIEKSGAKDLTELKNWICAQYGPARAQHLRKVLMNSNSSFSFWANFL
jgi:hypothetical protein